MAGPVHSLRYRPRARSSALRSLRRLSRHAPSLEQRLAQGFVPARSQTERTEARYRRLTEHFRRVDARWREFEAARPLSFAADAEFSFIASARDVLGGFNQKELWKDHRDRLWLFKHYPVAWYGLVDEIGYLIARYIDPAAVEVRAISLRHPSGELRPGSIQRLYTKLLPEPDFANTDPRDLTHNEIRQLQREHATDWLLSNHDAHGHNFLRLPDGHVLGIDKGQAYRYIGEDRLDIKYRPPNFKPGFFLPFYNLLFEAAQEGKVDVDPFQSVPYIAKAEAISDRRLTYYLAPLFAARFPDHPLQQNQFLQASIGRKQQLRWDFLDFYGRTLPY